MKRLILVLAIVMALMAFTPATALAVPPGPPTAPFPPCHSAAFQDKAPMVVVDGFGCAT
jgi:hypothetical protein